MVELIFRLFLIGGAAYAAKSYALPEIAMPILGGLAGWTLLSALISRRWLALGASLQVLGDSAVIAFAAGRMGSLNTFGFLVALPAVYGIARRGAHPIVASLAASMLYGAFATFAKGAPAPDFHAKVFAITLLGSLAMRRPALVPDLRTDREVEAAIQPEVEVLAEELTPTPSAAQSAQGEGVHEAHIARLERQILHEKSIAELMAIRPNGHALRDVASTLRGVLEVEATAIYVRSESDDDLVIQASAGEWPTMLLDTAIPMIPGETAEGMKWAIQAQIAGLTDDGDHASVLLSHADRLIGLVLIRHEGREDTANELQELASTLTTLVVEDAEVRRTARRAEEAELLYAFAGISQGSQTPQSLAQRVVRELSSLVRADGLSIVWTADQARQEGPESVTHGELFDVSSLLLFPNGMGIDGWLRAGTPEIAAFRALGDRRCDAGEALRSRIGSFILIPLQSGDQPFGFIVATTHRAGGLDTSDLLTMRLLGIELSRTISRLINPTAQDEGIVTPQEFHEMTRVGGAIVYIEPTNRDRLTKTHGSAPVDRGIRQFTNIVRGKLPSSGIVCRRDQDDLLAFLSGWNHEEAARWANEIQALASMIAIEGEPLAVRTKVANLPNRVISAA